MNVDRLLTKFDNSLSIELKYIYDNFDDKIIRYLLLLNEETMANDMLKKENRDAFALA